MRTGVMPSRSQTRSKLEMSLPQSVSYRSHCAIWGGGIDLLCKHFGPDFISQMLIMLLAKQDKNYGSGTERECENNDRCVHSVKAGSVRRS